jgi:hypothetical protein
VDLHVWENFKSNRALQNFMTFKLEQILPRRKFSKPANHLWESTLLTQVLQPLITMAHDVATTILSMAKSMQESAFEQARWRMNVSVWAKCQGPPYWYDIFIDFATDGKGLLDIKMKGRQRLLLRMSTEQSPITRLLLNELRAHFGGLVLLEPSGLAVQNAEWQVGTLLSLSPW